MVLPDRITGDWMDALEDGDLLVAESSLRFTFSTLEGEQKRLLGARYDLMRGTPQLLLAWDRWSRVNTEARARGLSPRRDQPRRSPE